MHVVPELWYSNRLAWFLGTGVHVCTYGIACAIVCTLARLNVNIDRQ